MGGTEQKYVIDAFQSNWVAPLGPNVDLFEKQLTSYTNTAGAVSLSSGTAALHLGLLALGVKRGDIVLCQSMTFAASAFPIQHIGAEAVFVDSELDTWNMDPALLKQAIEELSKKNQKPAAIVVVHLYGMPAKMNEILKIAASYEIPVIEDAAEALGSKYFDKPCGGLGDIGVLSFNGNKIITTSGGGAFLSNDAKMLQQARHWSAQSKEPAPYYLHKETGYNYRMSNICAGIGRGQMEVLEERVSKRREIHEIYRKLLSDVSQVSFLNESEGCYSNRWLTTILFDASLGFDFSEQVRLKLEEVNIESRPLWKPLHQQPIFSSNIHYCSGVSDDLFARGLCLPSGTAMTDEVVAKVADIVNSCVMHSLIKS